MIKLRPYQAEPARAIMDSVLGKKGLTFSVEIARQGGKNELSAQIEVLLLTLHMARGGSAVKASPTFKPQAIISMERLKRRLDDFGFGGIWRHELGYIVSLGEARQVFLSAEESASVVGHTADILLEIDESQDVSREKYSREFRPMGSSTNVTTVHYGTAWDDSTLLEEVKQHNLELERRDGVRRHFRYDWQEVGKYNPDYLKYVEAERQRLGEGHPLFLTQYALEPLHGGGRFLSAQQRAQLQGDHPRQHRRQDHCVYVAGIDLAGEAEQPADGALRLAKSSRDATVLTIAEVAPPAGAAEQAAIRVVEHYCWSGVKHPELYARLVDILQNVWRCQRIVVDATGIGEPVASFLQQALGSRVTPFKFSQQSKSELGFQVLAAVNSGRLKMYAPDGSEECRRFWTEAELCRSQFRPNQTISFFVDPHEGHDDFVMSLALAVEAAERWSARGVRRARGQ